MLNKNSQYQNIGSFELKKRKFVENPLEKLYASIMSNKSLKNKELYLELCGKMGFLGEEVKKIIEEWEKNQTHEGVKKAVDLIKTEVQKGYKEKSEEIGMLYERAKEKKYPWKDIQHQIEKNKEMKKTFVFRGGQVIVHRFEYNSELYVVKESITADKERFYEQKEATNTINHPNISPCYHFYNKSIQRFTILAPYFNFDGAEFFEVLKLIENPMKKLICSLQYLVGIGSGLCYLHELNLFHRDLKPVNTLVMWHGDEKNVQRVVICDFGMLKKYRDETQTRYYSHKDYLAPETWDRNTYTEEKHIHYDFRVDIYAYGKIIELNFLEILEMKENELKKVKSRKMKKLIEEVKVEVKNMTKVGNEYDNRSKSADKMLNLLKDMMKIVYKQILMEKEWEVEMFGKKVSIKSKWKSKKFKGEKRRKR